MKPNQILTLSTLALAALICSSPARALSFNVTIDTSALFLQNVSPTGNGPFYLDFQLNPGTTTIGNTATITNFFSVGGGLTGPAYDNSTTGASTSEDVNGNITLKDYSPATLGPNGTTVLPIGFAELYQEIAPTTTSISFTVALTGNSTGTTADQFVADILNSSQPYLPQLDTSAPDGTSLVTSQLGFAGGSAPTLANNVQNYFSTDIPGTGGDNDGGVTTNVTAAPEPAPWATLALGGSLLIASLRVRKILTA